MERPAASPYEGQVVRDDGKVAQDLRPNLQACDHFCEPGGVRTRRGVVPSAPLKTRHGADTKGRHPGEEPERGGPAGGPQQVPDHRLDYPPRLPSPPAAHSPTRRASAGLATSMAWTSASFSHTCRNRLRHWARWAGVSPVRFF